MATTEIYTLSLHDALPISGSWARGRPTPRCAGAPRDRRRRRRRRRSEEHTSELQSHLNIVCRLLLEKKKTKKRASCVNVLFARSSTLSAPYTHLSHTLSTA